MELLRDVGHVYSHFGPFGKWCYYGFKIGARFAPNVPWARKPFWPHLMELLGDVGHVESCFGLFGDGVSVGER
jgi:hypothetical protein